MVGKAKIIEKVSLDTVAPDVLEQRKEFIKILNIKSVGIRDARATLDKYNFNHSEVSVHSDVKYSIANSNIIVKMQPKENTMSSNEDLFN